MTGRSRREQWRGAIKVNSKVGDVNNKHEVCIINVCGALRVGDLPFLACPEEFVSAVVKLLPKLCNATLQHFCRHF